MPGGSSARDGTRDERMKDQRRGRNLALVGAGLQAVFAVAMLAVGILTGGRAAVACAWFLVGGVIVWLMAALLFYCRQLEEQEATELADLAARGEEGAGLFDGGRDLAIRPARGRRVFVARWVVPSVTLVLAGYHVTLGVLVLGALRFFVARESIPPMGDIGAGVLFAVMMGFLAFLFSRYATGLASRTVWRPLRAPAAQLLVGSLLTAAAAAGFVAAFWGYRVVDLAAAFAVPMIQFVLAAELVVSLVLDLYRPRIPDEERRLSYDSRIFGLLAEPAKIGHSIAETLNYQFGFEVSKTWFYRLLAKSLVPLVAFGAVVLVLMTSVVVVYEGQKCVVLHWGRRDAGRLLAPGLHVKWPWPIDTARHFDVGIVRELRVGVGEKREPRVIKGRELRLWRDTHGQYKELDFLVATTQPAEKRKKDDAPPPVHVIKLVVSVLYQIEDPYRFGYRFVDGAKLLESAAYREMVRYCASATIHGTAGAGESDRPEAIMTGGWGKASAALERRIRQAVGPKGMDLGVNIRTVRLIAVHPPPEAAEAFQAVLAAERAQDQARYRAEGETHRILSAMAGDPDSALELALAIVRVEQLGNLAGVRANRGDFDRALRGYLLHACANLTILRKEIHREALLGKLGGTRRPSTRPGQEPADYDRAVRAAVPRVSESVRTRLGDLLKDNFLKRLRGRSGTAKERLAEGYAQHLVELLAIRSAGERFDFPGALDRAREQADRLFARAAGQPAREVAGANAYRLRRIMEEGAKTDAFRKELLAYRANPNLYAYDRWLDVWDDVLPGMIKYVLGVDRERVEIRMNWERQRRAMEGVFEKRGADESGKE